LALLARSAPEYSAVWLCQFINPLFAPKKLDIALF
jgi:hypothetical protein